MTLLQAPHSGVRLLAANLSALWATPLATGEKGPGIGVMGAGPGAAGVAGEGLGMYAGGGGAACGSGGTLQVVVVILLGSNLSAKLGSATQGGRLEGEGAAGGGAVTRGRGWGGAGAAAATGGGAEEKIKRMSVKPPQEAEVRLRRRPHLAGRGRYRRC